jgi:dihydropyrimidinase
MFDLIVSGGTAVMPASTEAADIGVSGGKIAAIGAPGSLAPAGAGRTVDATGQIVIPGGIDPHIHCGMPIVGGPSNEQIFAAPPEQVSKAALYARRTRRCASQSRRGSANSPAPAIPISAST